MRTIYRGFKFLLLLSLIIIIVVGLTIQTIVGENDPLLNLPPFKFSVTTIEFLKNFFLKDDYSSKILSRVENNIKNFKDLFEKRIQLFTNLKSDESFVKSLFYFFVSRSSEEIESYLKNKTDGVFKDFIIVNKAGNILYKYGDVSYPLKFFQLTDKIEIREIEGNIVFLQNYSDKTLDLEIQLSAVLNEGPIIEFLNETQFPSCYIVNNKIYKNDRFPERWLEPSLSLKGRKRIYRGMFNLLLEPVVFSNYNFGIFGVVYPIRDPGSILLLALKIVFLIIICLILFEVDAFIEGKLKKRIAKKIKPGFKIKREKKSEKENCLDNEYEKTLEWVGKFIEKMETRK